TGEPCCKPFPHADRVETLAFDPNGRWLVTRDEQQDRLRLWDVATARVRQEIPGPFKSPRFLAVSPDGVRLAVTAGDGQGGVRLRVCAVTSGKRLYSAAGAGLAYSPDGRWLATRSAEGTTGILLDARTHQESTRLSGHEAIINSAAFSPDSRRLA